eukprot:10831364-Karenia_brevis.AAC.1
MLVEEAQEMVDRGSRLSKPGVEVIAPKAAVETIRRKKSKEKSRSSTYVEEGPYRPGEGGKSMRPPGFPAFMPLKAPSPP